MPASQRPIAEEAKQSFFEALYASREADAHEITNGIFLGAASAAKDRKAMQKRRISHVLIVHPKLPEEHSQHFRYGRAPLLDEPTANLLELLPDALAFLGAARQSGGKVFVYCAKGISRSSSIIIALLMLERGISFAEAWKVCEQKRPIVYPNVGFQQQLRFLEGLIAQVDSSLKWEERVARLRKVVPSGRLEGPKSPLQIRDSIGRSMGEAFAELEDLVGRVFTQPALLQQRELWKRQGLFFENLHKYKALPGSPELLGKARAAADRLRSLPKIFSDALKGVKLGLGVAKEIDSWVTFAEPLLGKEELGKKEEVSKKDEEKRKKEDEEEKAEKEEPEDPFEALEKLRKAREAALNEQKDRDSGSSSDDSEEDPLAKGKKAKKKKKKEKEKKSKKDNKLEKNSEKIAKKAHKLTSRIEKQALEAERAADHERQAAELAAEQTKATDRETAELEAEEAYERRKAAADKRAVEKRPRSPSLGEVAQTRAARAIEEVKVSRAKMVRESARLNQDSDSSSGGDRAAKRRR